MNELYIIGITGPSGAGKGAVSDLLASISGGRVLNADEIYHDILLQSDECKRELTDNFGKEILNHGKIDRQRLARIVFSEGAEKKLLLLNEITHRYVKAKTCRLLSEAEDSGCEYAILDAPLLIEANMHRMCSCIIAVLAPKDMRLERIMQRDGISKEAALMRISKQKDDEFYSSAADFTVCNDGDRNKLLRITKNIFSNISETRRQLS